MKKNDMLNESTIRRFMKLATIDGLSDKFVAENLDEATEEVEEGRMRAKRDEEEMREGEEEDLDEMRDKRDEDEMREGTDEDLDEAKDEDEMREGADEELEEASLEEEEVSFEEKMDMDMGADEPAAGGGMVSIDQLMSALEKALEDVLGQEVEVSKDGEDEMEMDVDMDMDMDAADAGEEMEADDEGDDDEELEEASDDVIEEVFARVIQRLTKETKSKK